MSITKMTQENLTELLTNRGWKIDKSRTQNSNAYGISIKVNYDINSLSILAGIGCGSTPPTSKKEYTTVETLSWTPTIGDTHKDFQSFESVLKTIEEIEKAVNGTKEKSTKISRPNAPYKDVR